MDLKVFFTKVRELERSITTPTALIASLETPDGGKAGVLTEVSAALAARMTVEGKARLATKEEAAAFRKDIADRQQALEDERAAARMQIAVISDTEYKALKGPRGSKNSD